MGRKLGKKRRRVTLAGTNPVITPADRRATDLLRNAQTAPIEVDDPYDREAKIVVLRTLRNDPLARMHDRNQIDDAQFWAGRRWQRDWETAERGPRAIDPSKEAVDGGQLPEPLTDSQRKAAVRLNEASATLGAVGSKIVWASLVEGLTAEQLSLKYFSRFGQRWTDYYAKRFKECLDQLAELYGLAMRVRA